MWLYRLLYIGYSLLGIGIAVVVWHGFNALKPSVREGEFEAVKKSESGWGVLIGMLMIGVGWLFIREYYWLLARLQHLLR